MRLYLKKYAGGFNHGCWPRTDPHDLYLDSDYADDNSLSNNGNLSELYDIDNINSDNDIDSDDEPLPMPKSFDPPSQNDKDNLLEGLKRSF